MPIPASGPVTFANIQTEFGGANPIGLSEYYAGGGGLCQTLQLLGILPLIFKKLI
jgi:hypothetical protein